MQQPKTRPRNNSVTYNNSNNNNNKIINNIFHEKKMLHSKSDSKKACLLAKILSYHKETLWGKDWIEYDIQVEFQPAEWTTSRRYSEFNELHETLENVLHKNIKKLLPKLPPKALVGNNDPKFLKQRCLELDKYIRALLLIPEVTQIPSVLVFLGALEDHTKAQKDVPNVKSHLHIDKLMSFVESGDIILFHTPGVMQAMQRSLTSSSYDHVGIVCRKPAHSQRSNSLYILEATADGVRSYPLKGRLRAWHLTKAHVSLRKLEYPLSYDMRKIICDFMLEMDGKDYGLNTLNFLRKKSVEDKNSYFCSEVVAACYKRLGLLPDDISSNTYLPASFAEAADLKLLKNAKLGSEILIKFKTPDVHQVHKTK